LYQSGLEDSSKSNLKHTRTFSYDRAGLGNSDKIRVQRSSLDQVHELHALLNNAKVKGPYIIVAHSIGGYNARLFAGTYPNEVAGIVFVDSSHENQLDFSKNSTAQVYKEISSKSDGEEQTLDEQIISANQVKEIRKKDALRNIPIIVLTADNNLNPSQDNYEERMKSMVNQGKDIASLSSKSKYIFVKDSGHYIQKDKPQVVIDSIQELIATVLK
jgi:pimeloyl-ACP methyl ester carboxylesterase